MKIEKLKDIYSYINNVQKQGYDVLTCRNNLDPLSSSCNPHMHKFWEVKIQTPESIGEKCLLTIVPPGVVHYMTPREMTLTITHHCITVTVDGKNSIWQIFPDDDSGNSCNMLPELLHVITGYSSTAGYASLGMELTGSFLKNLLLLIQYNIKNSKFAKRPRDIAGYALDYMKNCYFKADLSIIEIAAFAGVTPQYLNKTLRGATGMTTRKNLMEIRLQHAMELLETSDYLVKEVAALTGWNSPFYFSNVFRAAYGITPNEVPKKTSVE